MRAVKAERALLAELQGGCRLPLGAWARIDEMATMILDACVLSVGRRANRFAGAAKKSAHSAADAESLGRDRGRRNCLRRAPTSFFVWQEGPLDNRNKPAYDRTARGQAGRGDARAGAGERVDSCSGSARRDCALASDGGLRVGGRSGRAGRCVRATRRISTGFFSPARMRYDSSAVRWSESGRERSALGSVRGRVAAVGAATARALELEGMRVDYVAQTQTGESLGAELRDSVPRSASSAAAQRSRGRSLAVSAARGRRHVNEVIAYRTLRPETLDPEILGGLRRAEIDGHCLRQPLGVSQSWPAFVPSAELAGAFRTQCSSPQLGPPPRGRCAKPASVWRSNRTNHRRRAWRTPSPSIISAQRSTVRHA